MNTTTAVRCMQFHFPIFSMTFQFSHCFIGVWHKGWHHSNHPKHNHSFLCCRCWKEFLITSTHLYVFFHLLAASLSLALLFSLFYCFCFCIFFSAVVFVLTLLLCKFISQIESHTFQFSFILTIRFSLSACYVPFLLLLLSFYTIRSVFNWKAVTFAVYHSEKRVSSCIHRPSLVLWNRQFYWTWSLVNGYQTGSCGKRSFSHLNEEFSFGRSSARSFSTSCLTQRWYNSLGKWWRLQDRLEWQQNARE